MYEKRRRHKWLGLFGVVVALALLGLFPLTELQMEILLRRLGLLNHVQAISENGFLFHGHFVALLPLK